jgi:Protein of unknown function (DUF1585)/Protein of unknown function (DUF1588)
MICGVEVCWGRRVSSRQARTESTSRRFCAVFGCWSAFWGRRRHLHRRTSSRLSLTFATHKTIREQLALHRDVVTCNSCHRRIDPPGFALESFNEIGQYRERYDRPGIKKTDQAGAPVDPSGELSNGERFKDIVGLKALLVKRFDLVTKNLAGKLLTFATGRLDDPADKREVLQILDHQSPPTSTDSEPTAYGIRDLIHAIVQSPAFKR